MTKRYPLHHEDARPLYVEITQDEYDRLVKAEQELKKLQKKAFDFGCQVIDKESEARQTAIRWHIVATDGNPPKRGRYIVIRKDRTGMWVSNNCYSGKSWHNRVEVLAWLSRKEMLEAGIDQLSNGKG